jgi:uncharacterized protein YhbP (UPF0306 family)
MSVDVEKLVREHIDKTVHMSLATSKNNKPWVCEVHFAYDEDLNLYFRSKASRRHSQEIVANPNVAGNVIKQHELDEMPVGLYFEGTCERLNEGEARNRAFECLKERLNISDTTPEEAKDEDGHQFYKIFVQNWYLFGKFEDNDVQKYKLGWNGGERGDT